MTDINEYMASTGTPAEIKPKKRKMSLFDEDLKQKARLLCKCPQQWKSVSKYNPVRMQEFIDEYEFNQQHSLHESLFGFVHDMWALCVDKMTRGDGFVQTELKNDLSLRAAFETEGQNLVKFLTNRYKIVALTAIDGFNGKKHQVDAQPVVIEINDNRPENPESDQTVAEPETANNPE